MPRFPPRNDIQDIGAYYAYYYILYNPPAETQVSAGFFHVYVGEKVDFGKFRHVAKKWEAKLAETSKLWFLGESFVYFAQVRGV